MAWRRVLGPFPGNGYIGDKFYSSLLCELTDGGVLL